MKGIQKDGAIKIARGDPPGVDVEVEPFGRANPFILGSPKNETGAKGSGAYVEFDLPENIVDQPWVGARTTARIVTETPLRLEGLRPVFVRIRLWQIWKWWYA